MGIYQAGLEADLENTQILDCAVSGAEWDEAGGLLRSAGRFCQAPFDAYKWLTLGEPREAPLADPWSKLKISDDGSSFSSPSKKRETGPEPTSSPVLTLAVCWSVEDPQGKHELP